MRGGTSNGLFFRPEDLPSQSQDRDRLLLSAIGSPDSYGNQLNGLGGATSSTSKICIVGPSKQADCDVDFLFGHVSIEEAVIDYSGNCGNLSSAVGVYAIEQGLVKATGELTVVRVWQENLNQRLTVHVPTDSQGRVVFAGDVEIAGVSGTGAGVKVEFLNPGFDNEGHVFPTGNPMDVLDVPHVGKVDATLVHAGNATIFIEAQRFRLHGTESPKTLLANDNIMAKLEQIRCAGAIAMGLGEDPDWITQHQPATPKVCLLSASKDDSVDLVARIISMGKPHHAMTGTGAIALAVAAAIPGTVAYQLRNTGEVTEQLELNFAHAAGTMSVSAQVLPESHVAVSASMIRTARTLMQGVVFTLVE